MFDERPRLWFDFVDPGSLLMGRRLDALGIAWTPVGFELRTPSEPVVDPADPAWTAYWEELREPLRAVGVDARRPSRVPRTRKAHELLLLAESVEGFDARALGERMGRAYVAEDRDLGRIDVLTELAVEAGLDRTATRASLDVDRWTEEVERRRAGARAEGVRGVPTLTANGRVLEGVHDEETIRAFLGDERTPGVPDPA